MDMKRRKGTKGAKSGKAGTAPRVEEEVDEDVEEEGEEEEEVKAEAAGPTKSFEVEFEFYDPEETDFHSVRELLCTGVLGSADLDFSGLADSIVEQVNIGTMIKSGSGEGLEKEAEDGQGADEEDAALCGMLTALNLRQFSDTAWCKGLTSLLEEAARKCGAEKLRQLTQYTSPEGKGGKDRKDRKEGEEKAREVGLLVSERFVNLPLELIPALHKAALEDIEWSCTTEYCPAEERPFYFFTHFLFLARCRASPDGLPGVVDGPSVVFFRQEDEAFARAAQFTFSFPRPAGTSGAASGAAADTADAADGDGAATAPRKKKRRKAAPTAPADKQRAQERVAVLGLSRAGYEKAVGNLRKTLADAR
mmetsp:Transcript_2850/g.6817  ORF Transcript_2850/g.6817 Transcript_2850/m.6817 type:complete len:364 (+) Transcript_2850:3-1094(+)